MIWMAKICRNVVRHWSRCFFFMLVANHCGDCNFKWLKYMGDSSAAELKRTEAYQASQAGVETVRVWLQCMMRTTWARSSVII